MSPWNRSAGQQKSQRAVSGPLVLAAVVGAGCATTAGGPPAEASGHRGPDYVVEVTNRNWDGMHVYATKGSAMYRLGSVGGHEERTFRLPAAFVGRLGGLRLAARPQGGDALHFSEVLDLPPGRTLGWSLEPNLKLSFHWVR